MKRFSSVLTIALVLATLPVTAQTAPPKTPPAAVESTCGLPMGEGIISEVNAKKAMVTIDHKPITALGWDQMTMSFKTDRKVDLTAFKTGASVHFLLVPGKKKTQQIAAMCDLNAPKGTHDACMAALHKVAMKKAPKGAKACTMPGMDHGSMDHSGMGH